MSELEQSGLGSNFNSGSGSNGVNEESEFGKLVLKYHFASSREVKECLDLHRRLAGEGENKPIGQVFVEKGYLTTSQYRRLTEEFEGIKKPSRQQIPGYQILGKLGKGAMATVYKARQVSLDRIVAVKVLPKRYSENPEFVDRFYREGKAAAKLNHANIVQAIDVGEGGGYHYFIMEYVDGYTIHDKLTQNRRYSEKEAISIIIQIADALVHAHARGLIHRDVKPKNIMIAKDNVAKLADMGLAREVSDTRLAQSEAGRAYGTPYYISPEQIRGEVEIDARADIYSLGATFYHMVTGKVPFEAANPTAVMMKHLRETLVPPDHLNPELSIGCAEIIEVMMAKDRNDRYQNAQELLEDLMAVRQGRPPIHARKIFDMSQLAHLEHGDEHNNILPVKHLDPRKTASTSATWKITAVILLLLLIFSVLINIVLALR
ncbi:MAG: serine/threonine-protein kinase [Phycisphaerae bacterium]